MNLTEFRAWLDGYSEAIGEAPTPEQWAKIREKLETVCQPPVVVPAVWTEPYIGSPRRQATGPTTPRLVPEPTPYWPHGPQVTSETFAVRAYEGGILTTCNVPGHPVTTNAAGNA